MMIDMAVQLYALAHQCKVTDVEEGDEGLAAMRAYLEEHHEDQYPRADRVEVIDSTGRVFSRYYTADRGIIVDEQDEGHTIKIFAGHPDKAV